MTRAVHAGPTHRRRTCARHRRGRRSSHCNSRPQPARKRASLPDRRKKSPAQTLGAAGGVSFGDANWPAQLQNQAAGLFDVGIDSAEAEGFGKLLELTCPGGRIAFFGATTGNPLGLDLRKCFFRQISLLGTTMGSPADFQGMEFVERHRLAPMADRVFPLSRKPKPPATIWSRHAVRQDRAGLRLAPGQVPRWLP